MAMSTSFFVLSIASTTFFYTLSLHDALPISRRARRSLGGAAAEPLDGRDHGLAAGHGDRAGDGQRTLRGADRHRGRRRPRTRSGRPRGTRRSEEHTSELQSRGQLVCRLLLEKTKKK